MKKLFACAVLIAVALCSGAGARAQDAAPGITRFTAAYCLRLDAIKHLLSIYKGEIYKGEATLAAKIKQVNEEEKAEVCQLPEEGVFLIAEGEGEKVAETVSDGNVFAFRKVKIIGRSFLTSFGFVSLFLDQEEVYVVDDEGPSI